jgi:hypothetical protein
MNSYELSRNFCDWAFTNPDKIKPIHYAIYYFSIEHCNRLGWKDKFGLPSQMVMEAIGVKNWRTYSAGLNDLVEYGFIEMVEVSKNQYSSNIVAIVKNTKAPTKALDKALQKHSTKHSQSTVSIDKQLNNKQETIEQRKKSFAEILIPFVDIYGKDMIREFYDYWSETTLNNKKMKYELEKTWSIERRLKTWSKNSAKFGGALPKQEQEKFKAAWQ